MFLRQITNSACPRAYREYHKEDWVLDVLLSFLYTPEWKTPIDNFIDDNCTVFGLEDEITVEHLEVHKNF